MIYSKVWIKSGPYQQIYELCGILDYDYICFLSIIDIVIWKTKIIPQNFYCIIYQIEFIRLF